MKRPIYFPLLILLVISLFQTGCGEKLPDGMPPLTPCELTVTQGGAPLTGATVVLVPFEGTSQWNIAGITNEQGVLQVFTDGKYNGVPAGKYKILVNKIEMEDTGKAIPNVGEPGYDKAVAELNSRPNAKRFMLVDKTYSNPLSTPLNIDVQGKSPIKQNIDAGKAVRVQL